MGKAYSQDLRERVIAAVDIHIHTCRHRSSRQHRSRAQPVRPG